MIYFALSISLYNSFAPSIEKSSERTVESRDISKSSHEITSYGLSEGEASHPFIGDTTPLYVVLCI